MKKILLCPRCKSDILMPKVKKTDDKHLAKLFLCPKCDHELAYIDGEVTSIIDYAARLHEKNTELQDKMIEMLEKHLSVKDVVMQCALIELSKNQSEKAKLYLVDHLKNIGLPPDEGTNSKEWWDTNMALIMGKPTVQ